MRKTVEAVGTLLCAATICLSVPGDTTARGREETAEKTEDAPKEAAKSRADASSLEMVKRYLDAVGGRDTLLAIDDRTVEFKNRNLAGGRDTTAEIALYIKRGKKSGDPEKVREEWELPGFQIGGAPLFFIQAWDGEDGWVQMAGKVNPLQGRTLEVFLWQKILDDFFLHWSELGYRLKYKGKDKVKIPERAAEDDDGDGDGDDNDGEPGKKASEEEAYVVEAASKAMELRFFFSGKTGLLLKKSWRDDRAPGKPLKEEFYGDYKPISFGCRCS